MYSYEYSYVSNERALKEKTQYCRMAHLVVAILAEELVEPVEHSLDGNNARRGAHVVDPEARLVARRDCIPRRVEPALGDHVDLHANKSTAAALRTSAFPALLS